MHTQNRVSQDLPYPDGQLYVPVVDFFPQTGIAGSVTNGLGIAYIPVPTAAATLFYSDLSQLLKTGFYPTIANQGTQEQFGTAAGVAGPTAVAGTSGPLGTSGTPPILAANLPTLKGPTTGVIAKGFQINYVDILLALGTAATISQVNVTLGRYLTNVGSAPTTVIDMNVNQGSLGAIAVTIQRYRATNPAPAMLTTDGSVPSLNTTITTTGTGPAQFYGAILGMSYNYN